MYKFIDPNRQNFESLSLEKRLSAAKNIKEKYSDRVPVCLFRGDTTTPALNKFKFLVPAELSFSQFLIVVRKEFQDYAHGQAFYFFVREISLIATSEKMGILYERNKGPDNFLHITFTTENTYG